MASPLCGCPRCRANRAAGHGTRSARERGGGALPILRTAYTPVQRRALALLAESNPTPTEYRTERARILKGNP
jgi:hypothetical protein